MASGDVIDLMGFEAGAAAEDAMTVDQSNGTVTETATNKRSGSFCARVNRTGNGSCFIGRDNASPTVFPSGKRQLVATFHIYIATLPSSETAIFQLEALATDEVWVHLGTGGALRCSFEGANFSATVATLATGQLYRIDVRTDWTTSTQTLGCRVNGGTEQTSSHAGAAGDITGWRCGTRITTGGSGTFDVYYDDVVIYEGTSYESLAYAVYPLTPNGDVDSNWTITGGDATRAAAIDERPSDTTSHYIASTTSGQVQRVDLGTYTLSGTEAIKAVSLAGNVGSNGTTGTRTVAAVLQNAAGTDGTSSTWAASINGWKPNSTHVVAITKPGGGAWDQSALDGIRAKFTKSATADECRIANAWAQVAVLGAAGGTTFNQTVSASATGTPTLVKQPGKIAAASATGTAAMVRSARKVAAAASTATALLIKRPGKILAASGTGTAVMTSARVILQAITAAATGTASMARQARKIAATSSSATPSLTREVRKTVTVGGTGTPVLVKAPRKTLSASGTGSAVLSASRLVIQAITAAATGTATLVRRPGKVVAASSTGTPSFLKLIRKTLPASATGTATITNVGPPSTIADIVWGRYP